MATRYEVLPPVQRRLLPALAPLQRFGFVLYGSTAIALRLGHRVSIDFDFFTDRAMDRGPLCEAVPDIADGIALQDEWDRWTVQLRSTSDREPPLKLSFFSRLGFGRVGEPDFDDDRNILMASLDDLLGHKLKELLQGVEAKDYIDIASMLDGGQSLEHGLGAALALFPDFPSAEAVKALVYFEDPDLAALPEAIRATLVAHVDRLGPPSALPILSRRLGADP